MCPISLRAVWRQRVRQVLRPSGKTQHALPRCSRPAICTYFQFPSSFQLRQPLGKLSAARSIAFIVLVQASQASDVGSIPIARSNPQIINKTKVILHFSRSGLYQPRKGKMVKNGQIQHYLSTISVHLALSPKVCPIDPPASNSKECLKADLQSDSWHFQELNPGRVWSPEGLRQPVRLPQGRLKPDPEEMSLPSFTFNYGQLERTCEVYIAIVK